MLTILRCSCGLDERDIGYTNSAALMTNLLFRVHELQELDVRYNRLDLVHIIQLH